MGIEGGYLSLFIEYKNTKTSNISVIVCIKSLYAIQYPPLKKYLEGLHIQKIITIKNIKRKTHRHHFCDGGVSYILRHLFNCYSPYLL